MTFSSIQLRKEARPLLLPWTLTILAGFLSLFHFPHSRYSWSPADLIDWIPPLGFLLIPFLAVLPLGSEFHEGTFTLLLAQPVDRQKLWLQKATVTIAAVLPAASLYLFSFSRNGEFDNDFWLAAVWMVASTAGSVAGTLIARSAIGGLALSSAFFGMLFLLWSKLSESERISGHLSPAFLSITVVVLFLYAAAMVWLGRQMFLRFQTIDSGHGTNDPLSGTRFLPQIAVDWLRCKPRGVFLNLIRREFHLLRTVWLLTLLSFVTWTLLILFHIVRPSTSEFNRTPAPAGLAVILSLLIALLAGSLSLGEEKNWGTHAWQLTMPVSPSTQWAVKLVFALCASVICAVVVPLSVLVTRGWISGSPYAYLDPTPLWVWFVEALSATFLAFWCSCIVKGTVRSVIWSFPLLIATGLAFTTGGWIGSQVLRYVKRLIETSLLELRPVWINRFASVFMDQTDTLPAAILITLGLLLAIGLIQSHRLFRATSEGRIFYVIRNVVPPLAVLLVSAFVFESSSGLVLRYWQEQNDVLGETHRAIETLTVKDQGEADGFQILTVADLARVQPLSAKTHRWLEKSTIVVRRARLREDSQPSPVLWPYESAFPIIDNQHKNWTPYSATIRTERGVICNISYSTDGRREFGFLRESCE